MFFSIFIVRTGTCSQFKGFPRTISKTAIIIIVYGTVGGNVMMQIAVENSKSQSFLRTGINCYSPQQMRNAIKA